MAHNELWDRERIQKLFYFLNILCKCYSQQWEKKRKTVGLDKHNIYNNLIAGM